jgi:DNA-binding NtrC family response regulator
VLPLVIPPLRERRDDIPVLVEALLEKQALAGGGPVRELSADALALLAGGDWPGNVRELGNVLQQAAARNDDRVLAARHFAGLVPGATAAPAGQARPTAAVRPLRRTLAEAERAAIEAALVASGGVKVQAAKLLGISRAQFYEKLSAHGLMSEEPDMRRAVWFSRRGAS